MSALKVTFIDNRALQYDASADKIDLSSIVGNAEKYGNLYIGDKDSISMLQLQHRKCQRVVNCSKDLHGYSREKDVLYLNIDPVVVESSNSSYEQAYNFIDKELVNGNNVVIVDDKGNCQGAAIAVYYLHKKTKKRLSMCLDLIKTNRIEVTNLRPDLVKQLLVYEKKNIGYNSIALGGANNREIVKCDNSLSANGMLSGNVKNKQDSLNKKANSTKAYGALLVVGAVFGVIFGILYLSVN